MANIYIYFGAAGAGTGADWTNAYTTLSAALTAKAAGDDFWVAHDHAESTAGAVTLTSPGTAASPCRVICASRSGSTPPVSADLATTATVSTTGANAIGFGGPASATYYYGVTFQSGSAANNASLNVGTSGGTVLSFKSCGFTLNNTSASSRINLANVSGGNAARAVFDSCTFTFGSTSQGFTASITDATVLLRAGSVAGSAPATLFLNMPPLLTLEGVDLSALGSGKTLFSASSGASGVLLAKDCKLGASVTVASTPTLIGQETIVLRCDSGDTNYRTEKYTYAGTQTTETTIVRTGGASDGTTPIAWKLITTANSKRYLPFEALPISIWNETTGSAITLTVQGIWGGGAVPTNADIWMDVEYLGTSGVPLGSFASSGTADQLASGTNLAAGSGTWGGSTTKFTLTKQITPQEKGPITVYIKAALLSSTFYLDPKVVIS